MSATSRVLWSILCCACWPWLLCIPAQAQPAAPVPSAPSGVAEPAEPTSEERAREAPRPPLEQATPPAPEVPVAPSDAAPPAPPPPPVVMAPPPAPLPPPAPPVPAQPAAAKAPTSTPPPTPPAKEDHSILPQDFQFKLTGYFRAPLRVGVHEVDGKTNLRSPWLVDGAYASFNYTRLQEADWAEIFLNAGTERVTATVGLMSWLFSDSQSNVDGFHQGQLGIAQAFLTFKVPEIFGSGSSFEAKGGAFWDRYGYIGKYDTYMGGRLHQMGEHLKLGVQRGKLMLDLVHGVGAYRDNNIGKTSDGGPTRAFTLLQQLVASVAYDNRVRLGGYFIDSWSRDARTPTGNKESRLRVLGLELSLAHDMLGSLYLAGTLVQATRAAQLAPAIEVLHSFGGGGITTNYLGANSKDGTGSVFGLAWQYDYSLGKLFRALRNAPAEEVITHDLILSVFGLYASVRSEQERMGPVGDGVKKLKCGGDLTYHALSWLALSTRYDHVAEEKDHPATAFHVVSPRITFRTQWLAKEQWFIQYSRYYYGDALHASASDTAPLTGMHRPDEHVIKLQAQIGL